MKRASTKLLLAGVLGALALPSSGWACAACYGASDSPLAQGMNWGIAVLLGVVGMVLFGIAAFFVHVGIKTAKLADAAQSETQK